MYDESTSADIKLWPQLPRVMDCGDCDPAVMYQLLPMQSECFSPGWPHNLQSLTVLPLIAH